MITFREPTDLSFLQQLLFVHFEDFACTKLCGVDVVEAHCYLSISGELIVSRYVAESITMIAGRFGHVGLCQLRTKLMGKLCGLGLNCQIAKNCLMQK